MKIKKSKGKSPIAGKGLIHVELRINKKILQGNFLAFKLEIERCNMEKLLEGKRIFRQDGEADRYLLLSEDFIQKYYYFYEVIAIKKGELLYPHKWLKYSCSVLFPLDSFNLTDYEYIFSTDKWLANDIKTALEPFLEIQIDNQLNALLELTEIPRGSELGIRESLEKEAYKEKDLSIIEAFSCPNQDNRFIILDSEFSDDDITYERTKDFADKVILDSYQRRLGNYTEYLYKLAPSKNSDSYYLSEISWYYRGIDELGNFDFLKLIYDIEDMLPFTSFFKL
ncbi:hypothetical protein AB7942_29130 [Neobacillus sp. BF23-41]|uniref:hypothetical protein n=1 Tax=Neobacillus sp. BF23-41 TaxID=3240280 RepID=UPI0034E4A66B